ncbi:LysE family translocator [Pseudogemmobacter sonorensis]|uniref:LysE family translocator n=1 Tax=Pseudogemmobacter sonorensis TaxID=2989681 RepID=UPI00367374BD
MNFPVDLMTLAAFVPAGLALNLTPGADMMFVLAQGLRGGPRAGMAANLGIAAGCLVHVLVAALGLAALLRAHPAAFELVRWAGVAWLLWLAFKAWRAGAPQMVRVGAAVAPLRIFREALLVNLLNPKVALFILAFLPQFIQPARPVMAQFAILGLVFCLGGLLINGAVAAFSGRIGGWLAGSERVARGLNRISAGVFAALALRLAVMERG